MDEDKVDTFLPDEVAQTQVANFQPDHGHDQKASTSKGKRESRWVGVDLKRIKGLKGQERNSAKVEKEKLLRLSQKLIANSKALKEKHETSHHEKEDNVKRSSTKRRKSKGEFEIKQLKSCNNYFFFMS